MTGKGYKRNAERAKILDNFVRGKPQLSSGHAGPEYMIEYSLMIYLINSKPYLPHPLHIHLLFEAGIVSGCFEHCHGPFASGMDY